MVPNSASIPKEYPNTTTQAHDLKISKWLPFMQRLDSFQTAASALGHAVSESGNEHFKRCFSVHHTLLDLLCVSTHWFSKAGASEFAS